MKGVSRNEHVGGLYYDAFTDACVCGMKMQACTCLVGHAPETCSSFWSCDTLNRFRPTRCWCWSSCWAKVLLINTYLLISAIRFLIYYGFDEAGHCELIVFQILDAGENAAINVLCSFKRFRNFLHHSKGEMLFQWLLLLWT